MDFNIKVSENILGIIIQSLAKQPYELTFEAIQSLQQQASEQIEAANADKQLGAGAGSEGALTPAGEALPAPRNRKERRSKAAKS